MCVFRERTGNQTHPLHYSWSIHWVSSLSICFPFKQTLAFCLFRVFSRDSRLRGIQPRRTRTAWRIATETSSPVCTHAVFIWVGLFQSSTCLTVFQSWMTGSWALRQSARPLTRLRVKLTRWHVCSSQTIIISMSHPLYKPITSPIQFCHCFLTEHTVYSYICIHAPRVVGRTALSLSFPFKIFVTFDFWRFCVVSVVIRLMVSHSFTSCLSHLAVELTSLLVV